MKLEEKLKERLSLLEGELSSLSSLDRRVFPETSEQLQARINEIEGALDIEEYYD